MAEHLNILTPEEIYQLYGLPVFNEEQRLIYFDLSETDHQTMRIYRTPRTQLFFILQLGYFKAKQQFFVFELTQVVEDLRHIEARYFSEHAFTTSIKISKSTRLTQQKAILQLYDYRMTNPTIRAELFGKVYELTTRHSHPVFIFRELMALLERQRIVLPAYTSLQRLIESALSEERNRLNRFIEQSLSEEQKKALDELLEDRSKGFYLLTWLQQEAPNLNPHTVRAQIERKIILQPLYQMAAKMIPQLEISPENIRYYGTLADYYTIYKLHRMGTKRVYILLLCFVYFRYREINDTLIEAFRHFVRAYEQDAKQLVKTYFYHYHIEVNEQLGKVPLVLQLFVDNQIAENVPFSQVKSKVLSILNQDNIHLVSNFIKKNTRDKDEIGWKQFEEMRRKISYNLRYLFTHMDFESMDEANKTMKAVKGVKKVFASGKQLQQVSNDKLPQQFIPKHLRKYLFIDQRLLATRYEMFLYQTLRNNIEAGDIFVKDSFEHQNFDQDLIPLDYWRTHKAAILKRIGLPKLLQPIDQLLVEWEEKIEQKYKIVNQSIAKEENKSVTIKGKKADGSVRWHLSTPAAPKTPEHKIYSQFPLMGISQLCHWVDQQTDFLSGFTHILQQGAAQVPDKSRLIATMMAFGTNNGLADMANRSDISYSHLSQTAYNFIRQETLQKANQLIVDATAQLPMFEHYHIQQNIVHSSSDGQKFATQFDTFNSRHSSKYFGLEKGITAYTLVGNQIPLNAKIIGAHEHESYFVLDLLYHNPTAIKPQIHSTDTHGTNEVNFAILDFFGYQFAPRYRNITSKAKMIYSFQHPSHYKDYLLKPKAKIKRQLIIDDWDHIQRIIASLAMRTTNQSTIIRKLAAYKRSNKIQKAFWEYDNIVKTNFILDFIHSLTLRKQVEKALNRGEKYHTLRRHIFYAHQGKFRVHSKAEQQIWSECSRLIANIIIYYNTYLLSQLLLHYQETGNLEAIERLIKITPVAWQHVNIYGTYQFCNLKPNIDVQEILKAILEGSPFEKDTKG